MLKILLLMPEKKWESIDKRIKALEKYFSRLDRLGAIYDQVTIEYRNIKLPAIEMQSDGVPTEAFIKSITGEYQKDYHVIGVVFPYNRSHKYAGFYYPNTDKTDHKMDFYIEANEKSISRGQLMLEHFIEHEVAGHGVSLDLGLALNYSNGQRIEGADNTHHFLYNGNHDQYYKELHEVWKKKASIWSTILQNSLNLFKKKLK